MKIRVQCLTSRIGALSIFIASIWLVCMDMLAALAFLFALGGRFRFNFMAVGGSPEFPFAVPAGAPPAVVFCPKLPV